MIRERICRIRVVEEGVVIKEKAKTLGILMKTRGRWGKWKPFLYGDDSGGEGGSTILQNIQYILCDISPITKKSSRLVSHLSVNSYLSM